MSDDEDVAFMTTAERQSSDKVRAWANVMKLTEATADAILELGFNSMEALFLIKAEDLIETNIPIGQKKFLLKAVKKTFTHEINGEFAGMASTSRACAQRGDVEFQDGEFGNASGGNKDGGSSGTNKDGGFHGPNKDGGFHGPNKDGGFRGPNKDGGTHGTNKDSGSPEDHYIQAVLKQLANQKQQELSAVAVNPSDNSMNNLGINSSISWQDPQIYLKSSNIDCKINFYDISDFVSYDIGGTSMPEERLILDSSGGQLVFKLGPLRPKLESLSLCQWSRANLSIMYKLLSTGELTQTQVLDYLSYTMRFYHLLSSCEFVSVLFFDREYRRLQQQHNFRWGTDIPNLQSVYLRPKAMYTKPQASGPAKFASKQQDNVKYTSHSAELRYGNLQKV
ncbi:unnamed protein product [Mytilus coruscus]|uniref:SAM domain-containing protein n=1 Tax=Mytilus coruscus TaxID=42192 RepID=A0A6J8E6B9_MYTCO|nr:unnamed protein product [Mytilus coruscus]